jgi:MoxR-like ATPase
MHYRFPLLLSAIRAGVNVMLVGPAGSGKTTACEKAAELLGLPFYFTGAIDSPYKLLGFKTAQGETVRTPFREAFEHGGFFLFDEMDSSLPAAVTPFNAAQANRIQDFPDSIVKAHKDYIGIAACNTYGRGASREYVGRFQQDAAVLDRYVMLSWDYDTALEAAMLGQPRPDKAPAPVSISPVDSAEAASVLAGRWLERVQKVRERIESHKIRHVVSPRASTAGAKLLAAGWPWKEVEEAVLWKGLDTDARSKLEA